MKRPDRAAISHGDAHRYRLLVDAIADYAIYMLDPAGRVTTWNLGARRLLGYQSAEISGKHFSRFYTSEDLKKGLPAKALQTAATDGRFEGEGWRARKDGTRFYAHVVIHPIRREDGALIGYAKIMRDLSERKEAEQALHRSEQEFRLLVQGVTDYAIYMLDPAGRVTTWNAGAQRIKGYTPNQIIGQHFSGFYLEEDRGAGYPEQNLAIAAREGRFEKEGWRVRKDGTRFWAHVIIDAIRSSEGELLGFAKVTRDITERMEAQRALEQARDTLFQAQKMDAIGQLTGGIAHDFNNLLMVVLSSLDLLRRRLPPDLSLTPLIDNAVQGAERGAALTQRMLAFARKQQLKLEAVEISAIVGGMLGMIRRSLGPAVSINLDFASTLLPVMADVNQLETALLNLAVNARDAMPDGGTISIAARMESASGTNGLAKGKYVCLSVADTGHGMDEGTLKRVGEPFFTTKGVGKGTGLGLAMVQGVAAQSGGRLLLKSVQGEGTTAELWLPVAEATALPIVPTEPVEEKPTRSLRVLAVDDDVLVLFNTVTMLEDLGHRVSHAGSGGEALALVNGEEPFDLVITDHAMPQMTGSQLAVAIRQVRPTLPILLATGFAELPSDAGADLPILSKPFLQRQLAHAIADIGPWV